MYENRSSSSSSMVYRFSPAVGVLTRLLQPVKAHLHSQGNKLSLYEDVTGSQDSGSHIGGGGGAAGLL